MFMSELPHSVTVQKYAVATDDTSGGNVETWATRTASVPCLVTQQAGAGGPNGQTHTVSYRTQSAVTTDARPGDRLLVVAGPGFTAGLYLAVLEITNHGGVGGVEAFTRLKCRQVLASWTPDR